MPIFTFGRLPTGRTTKGQVDPSPPRQHMPAISQRRHAMKRQPRRAAPDHNVPMRQAQALWPVRPLEAAKQKHGRQAE